MFQSYSKSEIRQYAHESQWHINNYTDISFLQLMYISWTRHDTLLLNPLWCRCLCELPVPSWQHQLHCLHHSPTSWQSPVLDFIVQVVVAVLIIKNWMMINQTVAILAYPVQEGTSAETKNYFVTTFFFPLQAKICWDQRLSSILRDVHFF